MVMPLLLDFLYLLSPRFILTTCLHYLQKCGDNDIGRRFVCGWYIAYTLSNVLFTDDSQILENGITRHQFNLAMLMIVVATESLHFLSPDQLASKPGVTSFTSLIEDIVRPTRETVEKHVFWFCIICLICRGYFVYTLSKVLFTDDSQILKNGPQDNLALLVFVLATKGLLDFLSPELASKPDVTSFTSLIADIVRPTRQIEHAYWCGIADLDGRVRIPHGGRKVSQTAMLNSNEPECDTAKDFTSVHSFIWTVITLLFSRFGFFDLIPNREALPLLVPMILFTCDMTRYCRNNTITLLICFTPMRACRPLNADVGGSDTPPQMIKRHGSRPTCKFVFYWPPVIPHVDEDSRNCIIMLWTFDILRRLARKHSQKHINKQNKNSLRCVPIQTLRHAKRPVHTPPPPPAPMHSI